MTSSPAPAGADLRPWRRWYALAAAVAVLGVLVGMLLFAARARVWIDEFPDPGSRHLAGEAIPLDLRAGEPVVLYTSPTDPVDLFCTGEVAGAEVDVFGVDYTFTFFSGQRSWAAHSEIVSDRTGTGSLRCTGPAGVTLAIAQVPDNGHLLRILGGGIVLGAIPAVLGVVGGVVLAVRVTRRRRAHREELPADDRTPVVERVRDYQA
ncbi:hypothetical protein [Virgisporangium ochraceum]|nr:hypothetical protein [Virgisporangium ochraceum]